MGHYGAVAISAVRRTAPILVCLWVLEAGAAQGPAQRDVCVAGVVDKEKLGFALLDMYGVSRAFEASVPPNPNPPFNTLPVWERLLADDQLCPLGGLCSEAFRKRFQKDIDAASQAYFHLRSMLKGDQKPTYTNPTGEEDVLSFLTNPENRLVCGAENPGQPGGGPVAQGPVDKVLDGFRIRGSTDGLFYSRNAPQFKSLDPAVVGFNGNSIQDTRTDRLAVVLGYSFDFMLSQNTRFELVPYVGTNRNVVNQKDKPLKVNQETVDFGFLAGLYAAIPIGPSEKGFVLGNWVTMRPDYLFDLQDNSQLLSFNPVYTPVVNGWLNDYRRLFGWDLWLEPIFDLRVNAGVYTNRGTVDPGNRKDFVRAGSQFGIALSSNIPYLPLDLVVTDTYLYGFSGAYDYLNYFKAMLTFSFDSKRYFGVNLSYSDGRRADTGVREKLWSVSLSGKY